MTTTSQSIRLLQRAYRERDYVSRIRDVLGTAIGYRERDNVLTDELALIVYVRRGRKRADKGDYPRHQQIPKRVRLRVNGRTVWLPVDIIETPGLKLQATLVSSANVGNLSAAKVNGTVGWIARRKQDDAPVVCSNYHVLLKFPPKPGQVVLPFPRPGQPPAEFALSPSRFKGGSSPQHEIGPVVLGLRDPFVDVAIVLVANSVNVSPQVPGIGAIGPARSITPADLAGGPIPVQLRGSASDQVMRGFATQYPSNLPFPYPDLNDPLQMLDLIATDIATIGGDSGAVLLDESRRPIGILLGGDGIRSWYIHIRHVVRTMKLKDF
ncbi:MAG: hypothetical protein AABO58_23075 [Acidobacteriota bacterium]